MGPLPSQILTVKPLSFGKSLSSAFEGVHIKGPTQILKLDVLLEVDAYNKTIETCNLNVKCELKVKYVFRIYLIFSR